jgi:prolipoprotein diacylglyceryl transferase
MEYITWDVSPMLFSWGPVTVRWYGLLFATGFFLNFVILSWMFRREGRAVEDLDDLFIYVFVGTLAGARLGHCLFYDPAFYLSHPFEILKVWNGGLASHGGYIGVLIAGYYFAKRKQGYSALWLLDRGAFPLAMIAVIIRIGNLFNSEIVGIETTVPWAFIFERIDRLPRHPVQLYEALSYLAVSGVMLFGYLKWTNRMANGFLIGMFMLLMSVARFFLEFVKIRQASYGFESALSVGQWLSIPFILAGLFLVWRGYRQRLA